MIVLGLSRRSPFVIKRILIHLNFPAGEKSLKVFIFVVAIVVIIAVVVAVAVVVVVNDLPEVSSTPLMISLFLMILASGEIFESKFGDEAAVSETR